MTLPYINTKLIYLISEYRTVSDTKVYVQKVIGGGYNEVVFGANLPLNSAASRQIVFKRPDKDWDVKMILIERFLKKEITFNQLFNDK